MSETYKRLAEKESKLSESFAKKELECPVYFLDQVGSTMDVAESELKKKPHKFAIYLADLQKSGRGRQSRDWQSLAGNLFMTLSFEVSNDISKLAGFSLVAGLATSSTLSNMGHRIRLKWPNDLLSLSGRKIGGILVEIKEINAKTYMLCGIGININKYPSDIPNTTSLKEINGIEHTSVSLAAKLTPSMKSYFDKFMISGFKQFKNDWVQNAAFVGRDISVHISKDKKVSGMLLSVTQEGALQIENGGKIETITAGDIQLIE